METLRAQKILITGPAGQIAFPLARALARDNEVWGTARFRQPGSRERVEQIGVTTRTQTAIPIYNVAEPFIQRRAMRHLSLGRVVIFAAGTGNPYMTTDTTAALRTVEISADVLLMAKNGVDGVYSADPRIDPTATKYDELPYLEAINRRLEVMDSTALSMCMDNNVTLIVFNLHDPRALEKALQGEAIGTMVR